MTEKAPAPTTESKADMIDVGSIPGYTSKAPIETEPVEMIEVPVDLLTPEELDRVTARAAEGIVSGESNQGGKYGAGIIENVRPPADPRKVPGWDGIARG